MAESLKLDLGCGPNKKPGFVGVDAIAFPGVDVIHSFAAWPDGLNGWKCNPWPWDNDTVDEAYASHFLEHLTNLGGRWERVNFFNELYRVLKPGGTCQLIFPHWCSNRYYGDPTHKEPFSEMGFYYLSREWRAGNAPHTDWSNNPNGYNCDFEATWGYSLHPSIQLRNTEYQSHAMTFFKEAAQDVIATLKKK